jgi:chlorite dismutase
MSGRPTETEDAAPTRRQVVKFSFFKIDPAWRALSTDERAAGKQSFESAVASYSDRLQIRAYSVIGMRGDCELLLWQIGENLEDIQALHSSILGTPLGPHLSTPYSYLAMTRRSQYVSPDEASERLHLHPADSKYFFVYPFVKTREWYQLPADERQALMNEHIRVGRKYPSVKLNTTYSFGLDDQEFVVSFETDEPADFLYLVVELREAKTSLYTLRDTPIFTCVSMSLRDALDTLDGTATEAGSTSGADGWTNVGSVDDLADGASRLVYAAGEQVALFRLGERFFAVGNRCPHANGPLVEGTLDGGTITCPLHASRFNLESGEPLEGPTTRPLKTFDVRIENRAIHVSANTPVAQ